MGLRDRLMKNEPSTGSYSATVPRTPRPATSTRGAPLAAPDAHHELKHELHQKLIEKLDLQTIERLPRDQLRDELRTILISCSPPATCRSTASSASRWSKSCSTR